jgi:hypothetical protein
MMEDYRSPVELRLGKGALRPSLAQASKNGGPSSFITDGSIMHNLEQGARTTNGGGVACEKSMRFPAFSKSLARA